MSEILDIGKIRLDVPNLEELKTIVQSEVVTIANMPWLVEVDSCSDERCLFITVDCVEANKHWRCEGDVIFNLMSSKVLPEVTQPHADCEDDFINWCLDREDDDDVRVEFGDIVVEATVTVRKVIGLPVSPLCDFTVPQPNLTDVALIVEGKSLHVGKMYLAYHSPYFNEMFFSVSADKTKKEIPLEAVKYDEFVELLHVIFPSRQPVTVATFECLLRLAGRFAMQAVLHSCEEVLRGPDSEEIRLSKKLLWSEQYNLKTLKVFCLLSLNSVLEVKEIRETKEYRDFTDKMKAELLERMCELC